jgi:hypothetical protein
VSSVVGGSDSDQSPAGTRNSSVCPSGTCVLYSNLIRLVEKTAAVLHTNPTWVTYRRQEGSTAMACGVLNRPWFTCPDPQSKEETLYNNQVSLLLDIPRDPGK